MAPAWDDVRNVLCVRLDAIGDVLMTTPALRALRDARPGRRITLLTSPAGAEIARLVPEIDEVIEYSPPWMKATPPLHDARGEYEMAERLRTQGFDAAVIFTVYSQSPLPAAFLCHLAGIPLRLAHCHENPYQMITDWVLDPEPDKLVRHEVRRQLDLVAHIGCTARETRLKVRVPDRTLARARALLAHCGIDPGERWIVVHPGATAPSRRYPAESYARAAQLLAMQHSCHVLFTGNAVEAALIERIQGLMGAPSSSLAGRLTLHELVAVVTLAPVLIVNNTGPAHIAAAVGTPVVDLYALTNFQHSPWQVESRVLYHNVPCRGCYKSICPEGHQSCLQRVTPEEVAQAACELLAVGRYGDARADCLEDLRAAACKRP